MTKHVYCPVRNGLPDGRKGLRDAGCSLGSAFRNGSCALGSAFRNGRQSLAGTLGHCARAMDAALQEPTSTLKDRTKKLVGHVDADVRVKKAPTSPLCVPVAHTAQGGSCKFPEGKPRNFFWHMRMNMT